MKHILNVGDVYHSWIVEQPGSQHSTVRCGCGDVRVMRNWNIVNGSPKQCKECYHKDKIKQSLIPVGTIYGSWTVISTNYERKNSKTGGLKQEVQCQCGYTRYLELHQLKIGRTKQCLMCASKNRLEVYKDLIPIRYAKRIKCEANKRGLVYNLTLEDLYTKYTTQQKRCAISGVELNMPLVNLYRYEKNKNFVNSKNFTASLDRIDSKKGYTIDNIQWVHKDINKMKMDLPEEDFFRMVKQIYEHKQLNQLK